MTHAEQADVVITSNAIFTGLEKEPFSGSIAIKDNKIIYVGEQDRAANLIGAETKHFTYQDQLVMAGFNDFHIHLFLGSLSEDSVSLFEAKSEVEAAKLVKRFADQHPEREWIFGFRWYHVYWDKKELPHRSTLDQLIPDRPVFLFNDECHGAWVNTKALEVLGIDEKTPDPPFGEIVRDKLGKPTGFLYETAMTYAQKAFDQIPFEDKVKLLKNFQKEAARLGVTSISDMLPLPGLQLGDLEVYDYLDKRKELSVRIHFLTELNGELSYPMKLRDQYQSDTLKFSGLKQFLDGVPTTYTAFMLEPYSDREDTTGDTLIPVDYVKRWIMEADDQGFRIRLHACGDGAVRLGLDSFEEAQKRNGKRDSRHTIEHIEVIAEEDVKRFGELGIIASMQPEHMAASEFFEDNVYRKRLGREREKWTWPMKSLLQSNAQLAFGTDFPVVSLEPMTEIYRAVTRKHDDGYPQQGWNPEQKLTLYEALRAYTIGAAFGTFREKELGTLEVGKLADVIVLDQNLFAIDPEQIREVQTVLTIMDGKVMYQKGC
ncbi:amidohydrolase [Radiobacillus kanasensis]|uniref:amidohydrolase n=1 Tax=Radiobacillus kanasensis TaxID=2844358 RepID=UPI001E2DCEE8|nr:amidohydrolase [Radiobacillus kanasensis]UFT99096.1 amidohydrolase [Radiobacillus kanasensis]